MCAGGEFSYLVLIAGKFPFFWLQGRMGWVDPWQHRNSIHTRDTRHDCILMGVPQARRAATLSDSITVRYHRGLAHQHERKKKGK